MKRIVLPLALVLGFATAALAASTPPPKLTCPTGYVLHHKRAHVRRHRHWATIIRYQCVRSVRRAAPVTVTLPATTLPAATIYQATPAATVTTPQATITSTGTTTTVTTPPVTTTTVDTTTVVDTTVLTDTVTAPVVPPVTTPDPPPPTTTATTAVATLAWCGGHGGNWADNNCNAPPNPLAVPTGGVVDLDAATTGSLVAEPFPLGYLTYTVAGPAGATWSEFDQAYGLNPDASQDCSHVENFSGQAEGACQYVFGTPGQYTITVGVVSGDYPPTPSISTTLVVG